MMRVLHFLPVYVPAWKYGGPILSVSRLCQGLVQQGIDVRVITTNAGLADFPIDQLGIAQNVNGVQVFYYPVNSQGRTIRSKALVESLSLHMAWAQLLHLSAIWHPLGLSVQQAAHESSVPIIHTIRGALGPYSWTRGAYKKLPYFLMKERPMLQRSALLHCTTPQEERETRCLRLKPPIKVLANPLDLSRLYCDKELGRKWRRSHNIPANTTLFLVAGRFHHKKGLDLLPRVLSMLPNHDWHIAFIGDDNDGTRSNLFNALHNLGLSSQCHWSGSIPSSDLLSPLNAADWLLLPSRHENFGNIVVEALSCGCGVVLSDRVGVQGMLDGCPGVLSGPRDRNIWSKLLQLALNSSRPGPSSESWVKQKLSMQTVSTQAIKLYESILKNA